MRTAHLLLRFNLEILHNMGSFHSYQKVPLGFNYNSQLPALILCGWLCDRQAIYQRGFCSRWHISICFLSMQGIISKCPRFREISYPWGILNYLELLCNMPNFYSFEFSCNIQRWQCLHYCFALTLKIWWALLSITSIWIQSIMTNVHL